MTIVRDEACDFCGGGGGVRPCDHCGVVRSCDHCRGKVM